MCRRLKLHNYNRFSGKLFNKKDAIAGHQDTAILNHEKRVWDFSSLCKVQLQIKQVSHLTRHGSEIDFPGIKSKTHEN